MVKKYLTLFFLILGLNAPALKAQESMMTDVSYLFLEKLIATAKENYPRANSFKAREAIAKGGIAAQKSAWLDGLSFSYFFQPDKSPANIAAPAFFQGYQAGVQLNVNSFFKVRQAKESLKLVNYEEDEYMLTLETQVKARYYSYVQQMITLRLQTKLYADAVNLNKDVNNKYSKGEVPFASYLQAQTALMNATQTKIAAEAGFLTSKAALEELITKKIEEVQ